MSTDNIKAAFRSGEMGYLDAIIALERQGMNSKDAESLVLAWEQEPPKSQSSLTSQTCTDAAEKRGGK